MFDAKDYIIFGQFLSQNEDKISEVKTVNCEVSNKSVIIFNWFGEKEDLDLPFTLFIEERPTFGGYCVYFFITG